MDFFHFLNTFLMLQWAVFFWLAETTMLKPFSWSRLISWENGGAFWVEALTLVIALRSMESNFYLPESQGCGIELVAVLKILFLGISLVPLMLFGRSKRHITISFIRFEEFMCWTRQGFWRLLCSYGLLSIPRANYCSYIAGIPSSWIRKLFVSWRH